MHYPKPLGLSEEEFVELEVAHEEFAATDDPSADVRFAGVPQTPPPLAPPRSPQLAPYAVTQPTTRRRLADVVAEESNRPRSRRWLWITAASMLRNCTASASSEAR